MLPNGWKRGTIEDIAKVSSGGTPSRKKESYWNGSISWVTTSEVKFGVIAETHQTITEEGLKNSSAKLFPKETLLLAMYGQGKTRGQVAKLGIEASTNQACAALLLNDDCEVDYYYQYLMSQYENIRELANSGGQQNLSAGIIKSIPVPIPPLPEQRKIAKILSTWDKAIVTTEKLIATSKQQKKALMQQLLTGKKRLVNPETGRVFEGEWEEIRLEQAAGKIYGGGTPSRSVAEYWSGNIPWVTVKDLTSTIIKGSQEHITIHGLNESSSNLVPSGTVIIATRMALGKAVVATKDVAINQDLKAILPSERLISSFLHYWFLDKAGVLEKMGTGSTVKGIQIGLIKAMLVALPSIEEQQKIAQVLTAADKEIEHLQSKLAHFQQEKKALMQQLLTGKRRVKIGDAEAA